MPVGYGIRPDGAHGRQLTHPGPGVEDTQPDWAPSGDLVTFQRCPPDAACAIYTVRPTGRQLTRLTPSCHDTPHFQCPDEVNVAFLPDGRHVVFTRSSGPVRVLADGQGWRKHYDLVIRDLRALTQPRRPAHRGLQR